MATTQPAQHLRRSMIYRILAEAGAEFEVLADTAVAMRYADGGDEMALARRMGLAGSIGDRHVLRHEPIGGVPTLEAGSRQR